MKSRHYWKSLDAFRQQLRMAVPQAELKELHRKDPLRHHLYALRQFGIIGACSVAMWHLENPLLWLP